jgi:hypothetical protein
VLSEGRDNMQKGAEERARQAWWRRIGANRVSHFLQYEEYVIDVNDVQYWIDLTSCLFQENKSYGAKTIALILCPNAAVHHAPNRYIYWKHAEYTKIQYLSEFKTKIKNILGLDFNQEASWLSKAKPQKKTKSLMQLSL